ncbi:MAG: CDP-diacylglycerol--serine O-phosphatidyltransferase [Spirochaetes bacterium]|nr:MAG: CDP-diacylglycerol--serine O-phosphatidyltransferase [Spirochaetota bacterium]
MEKVESMNLAWIPNSLTMGNLVCGFISLVFSSNGSPGGYLVAGLLILGAALLDGLDGQVARALKVESKLGMELDSLADCVTFGVAPGYLAYKAYLSGIYIPEFGFAFDFGILIASIYPVCAAYRLARFNVVHATDSFSGLPSPVAGVIMALVPVSFGTIMIPKLAFGLFYALIGLLMVSTFKYTKPQSALVKNIHGIKLLIFLIVIILLVVFLRQWAVFAVLFLYVLSGILSFVIQFIQDHKY